jgi:hypothetical protein
MDNPITTIEKELQRQLLTIRQANTLPSGYTYYNDVTLVNLDDESIILDRGDYPVVNIFLSPVITPYRQGADCTQYTIDVLLKCKVSLEDESSDTPQYEINKKLNDLLIDIEACIYSDRTLNCSADTCDITSVKRVNTVNGDQMREADLHVSMSIKYISLDNNPNIRRG